MRPTLREIVGAFTRPFTFLPFFAVLYLSALLVGMLERTADCFPMTVITADRSVAERLVSRADICQAAVEAEKFMIESAIFGDADLPPVRDLYLVMMEAPFTAWEEVRQTGDAVAEMNPFLKRMVELYLAGRLKLMALVFIVCVVTAVMTFPFALPRRTPFRRLDIAAALFSWMLFVAGALAVLAMGHPLFIPTALLSIAAGLFFALIFRLLLKKHETRSAVP